MASLTATELATQLGLSKPRISQYVSEGKLAGCFVGDGRARRFDLGKVTAALGRGLDRGQMLGNGAATRKTLQAITGGEPAPKPAPLPSGSMLPPNDPDRYELARILNAEEDARRKRRDNERDEGRWVLADEVQRQTTRAMAQEIAQFESALREMARMVADRYGLDYREVRSTMMEQWRAHRGKRAEALSQEAEGAQMTPVEIEAQI